jgi:hypothetical protein
MFMCKIHWSINFTNDNSTIVVSNAISIFHIGSQCYTYHVDHNDNENVDGSCTPEN